MSIGTSDSFLLLIIGEGETSLHCNGGFLLALFVYFAAPWLMTGPYDSHPWLFR